MLESLGYDLAVTFYCKISNEVSQGSWLEKEPDYLSQFDDGGKRDLCTYVVCGSSNKELSFHAHTNHMISCN